MRIGTKAKMIPAALIVGGCVAWAAFCQDERGAGLLPDPVKTPGEVASSDPGEICQLGYSKAHRIPYRTPQEAALHTAAFGAYNIPRAAWRGYEDDHLIPLCLGGADSVKNRWPQTRLGEWNAARKDRLELKLCHIACLYGVGTQIDVSVLQRAIATDWIKLAKEMGE